MKLDEYKSVFGLKKCNLVICDISLIKSTMRFHHFHSKCLSNQVFSDISMKISFLLIRIFVFLILYALMFVFVTGVWGWRLLCWKNILQVPLLIYLNLSLFASSCSKFVKFRVTGISICNNNGNSCQKKIFTKEWSVSGMVQCYTQRFGWKFTAKYNWNGRWRTKWVNWLHWKWRRLEGIEFFCTKYKSKYLGVCNFVGHNADNSKNETDRNFNLR